MLLLHSVLGGSVLSITFPVGVCLNPLASTVITVSYFGIHCYYSLFSEGSVLLLHSVLGGSMLSTTFPVGVYLNPLASTAITVTLLTSGQRRLKLRYVTLM